jgi:hypothetical protein
MTCLIKHDNTLVQPGLVPGVFYIRRERKLVLR